MDEIYLCLIPPKATDTPIVTYGYQIHIRKTSFFDVEVEKCIEEVAKKSQLSFLEEKEEEKIIIYRKH